MGDIDDIETVYTVRRGGVIGAVIIHRPQTRWEVLGLVFPQETRHISQVNRIPYGSRRTKWGARRLAAETVRLIEEGLNR